MLLMFLLFYLFSFFFLNIAFFCPENTRISCQILNSDRFWWQGSHSSWKTWKNKSTPGKIMEKSRNFVREPCDDGVLFDIIRHN